MNKSQIIVVLLGGVVVGATLVLAARAWRLRKASHRLDSMGTSAEEVDAGSQPGFACRRCGQRHKAGEIGFKWPDAVYALDLSEQERAEAQEGDNEDVAVVKHAAHFVRGWAPIPVHGRTEPFGIGFWIQVSADAFREFEAHNRHNHPSYEGRIANQSTYLGPTLGVPARMEDSGINLRPRITLLGDHPLARAQRNGIDRETELEWMEDMVHAGDPQTPGQPFTASLAEHGWEVMAPEERARVPVAFTTGPVMGENLKLLVRFTAADAKGDPVPLTAGWWVRLVDSSRPDRWTGTLANHPRVPAALSLGSRVWFSPHQVIERDAGTQERRP